MRAATTVPISLLLLACSTAGPTPQDPQPDAPEPAQQSASGAPVEQQVASDEEPIDPRFTDVLLTAAREYQAWGRVDEHPNVAPMLCRAPQGLDFGFPSHARLSGADDAQHGRKLYYLYAGLGQHSVRHIYRALGTAEAEPIPDGFVIVKQSWVAKPSSEPIPKQPVEPDSKHESLDQPSPITWVEHEGQRLDVGEQAELFVMAKLGGPELPGTDAGWIYGTLTPDGRTVTSAGRVQRCMDCHVAASHERLFGLQETKAFAKVKRSPWFPDEEPLPLPPGFTN
jgi:hypothetical protein